MDRTWHIAQQWGIFLTCVMMIWPPSPSEAFISLLKQHVDQKGQLGVPDVPHSHFHFPNCSVSETVCEYHLITEMQGHWEQMRYIFYLAVGSLLSTKSVIAESGLEETCSVHPGHWPHSCLPHCQWAQVLPLVSESRVLIRFCCLGSFCPSLLDQGWQREEGSYYHCSIWHWDTEAEKREVTCLRGKLPDMGPSCTKGNYWFLGVLSFFSPFTLSFVLAP